MTTTRLLRLISILLLISSVYLLEEEKCDSDGQTFYINTTSPNEQFCYDKYCTCIQCPCTFIQMRAYITYNTNVLENMMLIIMDGEYAVNSSTLVCNNFRNITIRAQNEGKVIFRGNNQFGFLFDFGISTAVKIKDLIFEQIELIYSIITTNQGMGNEIIIEKCLFKNNKVNMGIVEGLIVKSTGKVVLIDCEIYDHTIDYEISNFGLGTINGGLINGIGVEILNCKFENNTIKGDYSIVDGGLILSNSITIKDSIFRYNKIEGNITTTYGMISSKLNALIVNSNFSQNMINISIIDNDGVIIDDPPPLQLPHYSVQGGVIKVIGNIEIQSCEFDSNSVSGQNYYGEFVAIGATVVAKSLFANSSSFIKNNIIIDISNSSAVDMRDIVGSHAVAEGGAIAVSISGNITNCLFQTNFVMLKSDLTTNREEKYLIFALGGAIHSNDNLIITNSNLTNNFVSIVMDQKSIAPSSTIAGGAISSMGLTTNATIYQSNYAINFGGAIYLASVFTSHNSLVENCQFEKNIVSGGGGGGGAISSSFSTFIGGSEFEYLSVIRSSFSRNSAELGKDIYLDNVIDDFTAIGNSPIDVFIAPSPSPSLSPSRSVSPSPSPSHLSNSNNDNNDDNDDNTIWIVLVIFLSLFAFILTLIVIFLITALVCLLLRERSKRGYSPTVAYDFDEQNAVPMKEIKVKDL